MNLYPYYWRVKPAVGRLIASRRDERKKQMEGRALIQYLIDTSGVVLAKKQEATEYLAKLEAAQQSVQRTAGTGSVQDDEDQPANR